MNDWYKMEHKGEFLIGEGVGYSLDDFATGLNNNVCLCAAPGRGKTRNIITPNLLQAEGSYVIADPKGNLYAKWKDYLIEHGYEVHKLDFTNPLDSIHYNPLTLVKTELDILKLTHQFVYGIGRLGGQGANDPFWEKTDEMLLTSVFAYVLESPDEKEKTLSRVIELISMTARNNESKHTSPFAKKMEIHKAEFGRSSLAVRQFELLNTAPSKTFNTICVCAAAELGKYTAPDLVEMMKYNDLELSDIGKRKMAVFVVTSDADRSMDTIASLFYSQLLQALTEYADRECENQRLPIPVRFFLDDFATNMRIADFPKIITSIRSRNMSVTIVIQSESQLRAMYGNDANTIIGSCDTYAYLGNNDVENAQSVALRASQPIENILCMPLGKLWIFRTGMSPLYANLINYNYFVGERLKEKEGEKSNV